MKILEIKIAAYYKYIKIVKNSVELLARVLNFDEEKVYMIKLAIAEALTNIIEHSYKAEKDETIEININIDEKSIAFEITDYGTKQEISNIKSRNLQDYQEGGLGVHIIQSVMDEVKYIHIESGTKLIMRKDRGDL